jgi:hypothetical protein
VNDRFAKGEVITSKDEYFVTAPRFTTASKKYGWINHLQAVGKMVAVQKYEGHLRHLRSPLTGPLCA